MLSCPVSPHVGPGLSFNTNMKTEHHFLCSVPSVPFWNHSSQLLLQACQDQKSQAPYFLLFVPSLIKQGVESCSLLLFISCFELFFFHFSSLSHSFHYCLCLCKTRFVLLSSLVPFVHCTSPSPHPGLLHQLMSSQLHLLVEKVPFLLPLI